MTNLENQYLTELALTHCESWIDELAGNEIEYSFTFSQLQAFAENYASQYLSERNECVEEIIRLQAKIDALMLEYCHNEMTEAQKSEYENSQKRASPTIERLLKESK